MTPLQLDMLLHYHVRPSFEYSKVDENRVRREQAWMLEKDGLLSHDNGKEVKFSITTKGTVHVNQVLALTIPVECFKLANGLVV